MKTDSEDINEKKCRHSKVQNRVDSIFPKKTTPSKAHPDTDIVEMRSRLDDPEYMDYAIYRLAVVITDKIFSIRGEL